MTSFIAVILSILLFFYGTLMNEIKYTGAKIISREILENSVYSVMADYNREIREKYGIYCMMSSWPAEIGLKGYIEENTGYERKNGFIPLEYKNINCMERTLEDPGEIKRQILEFCKYRIPVKTAENFLKKFNSITDFLSFGKVTESEAGEYERSEEAEKNKGKNYDMRKEAAEILKSMNRKKDGDKEISDDIYKRLPSRSIGKNALGEYIKNYLDELSLLEGGEAEKAVGYAENIFKGEDFKFDKIYESFLINEYIIEVFNSGVNIIDKENFLENEIEYIIFGNKSDGTNADYFKFLTILIRFLFNSIYIYQDKEINTIAEALAYAATIAVEFQGKDAAKQAIILSWNLIESNEDYKILKNNGKVPLFKKREQWKTWIHYNKRAESVLSLSYNDYLRLFLLMIPEDVKIARIMDLIYLNCFLPKGLTLADGISAIKASCVFYFKKREIKLYTEVAYAK